MALDNLTLRECAVLHGYSKGLSNRAIARELDISPNTVKEYGARIRRRLHVHTRAHAVAIWSRGMQWPPT